MKIKKLLLSWLAAICMLLVIGCPQEEEKSESEDASPAQATLAAGNDAPAEGFLRIHFKTSDYKVGDTTTLSLWLFEDVNPTSEGLGNKWPKGFVFTHVDDFGLYYDAGLTADPSSVGIVVVEHDTGKKHSSNQDVKFLFPKKYNQIYLKEGSNNVYINKELNAEPAGLISANILGNTTIGLKMSGVGTLQTSQFTVKDVDKNNITVTDVTKDTLTIANTDYLTKAPYSIEFDDGSGIIDTVYANIEASLLDTEFLYEEDDLGWHNGTAKVWAPLASAIEVLVYNRIADAESDYAAGEPSNKATSTDMVRGEKGVWSASVEEGKYYMYNITNGSTKHMVCDIYASVASPDSIAAKAVELSGSWDGETSYVNPWGNNGTDTKKYTEAVIYEMHIRDWSKGISASNKGKFDEITAGLGTNGNGVFGQHLKDLGITHVQILPMFDYAQKNSDPDYNWGYNPYQYNVPEGRYVNNHDQDGMNAVTQMRNMIKAFHDAGIAVNMDVVYNHTSGTGEGSLFDMTVPMYYYRLTDGGGYSNGSGCGNETASDHLMYRKFMIDSLKHWVQDYHINGFRFDLMGLHETSSTMRQIYNALKELDQNIMVYGEPWNGGSTPVKNGLTSDNKDRIDNCCLSDDENGVACFNDDYRNGIKGAEFGGFAGGQVQGKFMDGAINLGLIGSVGTTGFTTVIGRSINYAECHDNYTLADKLAISMNNGYNQAGWKAYDNFSAEQQTLLRNENKLAAAFIFLAKGTPFINGGQEFMRTKQGDENSYISSDAINAIDMSFKTKYQDVYNVYKGLIALRHANSDFTSQAAATATTVAQGFTKYITGDFLVYFNATAEAQTIDTTGYTKVIDVTTGTPTESTTLPTKVSAKGFVILKK